MTPEILVDIARDSILTLLIIAGPLMAISMIVGLIVSILQALTQIQEMTLTFVPKMLIMFGSLILLLPFMMTTLNEFFLRLVDLIIGLS